MASRTAGSARYKRRASSTRRRLYVTLIVLVVIGAAIGARSIIFPKANKPVAAAKLPVVSVTAKQSEDVGLVAGAVGQYSAANNALPTKLSVTSGDSLVLCGDVCDPTAYTVSGFNVYNPSNIRLMRYAPGLAAPSQSVMYLVPGAKCGSDGAVGGVDSTPRSMVLLYATATTPRCVVL